MAILKSCCCFSNVRTGSFACAIYSMLMSVVNIGISCYNLYLYGADLAIDTGQLEPYNDTLVFNESISHVHWQMMEGRQAVQNERIWFVCTLVVCVLWFLSSFLLLIGINKDRKALLLPWICATILNIALDTISLIYQCTNLSLLIFNIIQMVIWLGLTMLNSYCVLCVISQYQELKAGRGTIQYIRQQALRMMYLPGVQQVNITQGPIIVTGSPGSSPPVITSTVQTAHPAQQPLVTATVMMSPPDYTVASSQIPQYQEAESSRVRDVLLVETSGEQPEGTDEDHEPKDSPPPPYTP